MEMGSQFLIGAATSITPINMSNSTRNSDERHRNDAFFSVLVVSSVIIATSISSFLGAKKLNRFLPESGAAILLGTILGGLILATGKADLMKETFFQPEMFYFFLLPPIIFEAGFSMKKKDFFLNMGSVLLFAIIGTFISALVFGYCLFFFAKIGWIQSIEGNHAVESLLFGALISATDPVATLSVMTNLNVKPLLFSLVFGESVLNDAVSIVLYRTLSGYVGSEVFTGVDLLKGIVGFFEIFLGSLAIGIGFGLISAFFMKRTTYMKEMPAFQVGILIAFAYLSYVTAELLGMTGVVSLFISGAVMKHYNWYSLSEEAQVASHNLTRLLAILSETAIFVSLGINLITSLRISQAWNPKLLFISTVLLFVSRACNIFPLAFIANLKRKTKISFKMQVMLWFAGMRGAIAFALSINLATSHSINVQTTTLFLVVFTTLIQGSLTSPLLRRLGLVDTPKAELDFSGATILKDFDDEGKEMEEEKEIGNSSVKRRNVTSIHKVWRRMDERVMKPLFGGRKRGGEVAVDRFVFTQLDEQDEALLELEDDHESAL